MRYKNNYQVTYTTYKECVFDLQICGCLLNYTVSSVENCKGLEKAINEFAELVENKDMIPALLELLDRCISGNDVKQIKELMALK